MRIDWKRLGWSFFSAVILLLLIKLYFCKYTLSYGTCVLYGMLRYFFTEEIVALIILIFMIYIIWPVFRKQNRSAKRTRFESGISNERGTFRYSITSLVLIIIANFLVIAGSLYNTHARKGYYVGTEGLGFMILAFVLAISFIIIYVISIVKTINISGTDYGKKSLRIIAITALMFVIDIFLLVHRWLTINI